MNWLWIPQFVIMICFFLVFPDGHLLSPRWGRSSRSPSSPVPRRGRGLHARPADRLQARQQPHRLRERSAIRSGDGGLPGRHPGGLPAGRLVAGHPLSARRAGRAAAAALGRLRGHHRSRPRAPRLPRQEGPQALFILALCGLPIAAGVAILRYHLFDIDLIINRTLVYVTLTAILAGIYTASVTLMQRRFIAVTGERSDAVFVLTTLVVVVVFTPVKNALQSIVDRRFKEVRDPTAPLAAFVARLQDGLWRLDPDLVVKRLLAVSVDSLAASGGVVALDGRTIERIGETTSPRRCPPRPPPAPSRSGGRRPSPGRGALRGSRSDRPRRRGRRRRGGPGGPAGRRARGSRPAPRCGRPLGRSAPDRLLADHPGVDRLGAALQLEVPLLEAIRGQWPAAAASALTSSSPGPATELRRAVVLTGSPRAVKSSCCSPPPTAPT